MHESCLQGVDNLLELGEFNEGALLHTIRQRFARKQIYTMIGSPILVSLNPYQKLKDVFTTEVARKYRQFAIDQLKGKGTHPGPHLFQVAEESYQSLMLDRKN